jgi:Holliday junction resolvase RusA-like endonuclease
MSLHITVVGTPRPQGSKRPVRNKHTGRIHMVESSERLPDWRADIRDAAMRATDDVLTSAYWERPLAVSIWFTLPRPKGHYLPANTRRAAPELRPDAPKHPAGKPDTDKLLRAVLDALTGLVWRDDAQVVDILARKVYGERPGADITVSEAP